jgi:hypothetical protein
MGQLASNSLMNCSYPLRQPGQNGSSSIAGESAHSKRLSRKSAEGHKGPLGGGAEGAFTPLELPR